MPPASSTSNAIRFVAALSLAATSSVRGCTLGAQPICYPDDENVASIPPPWNDAGDASFVRRPPRMRCRYPIGGPLPPPELRCDRDSMLKLDFT